MNLELVQLALWAALLVSSTYRYGFIKGRNSVLRKQ